ncbi:hypothetical protein [Tenuibacillus multivorans]|nr:hypothetical protein [Tenuibacillus multivorans]GEL75786.1 hypothetical protein TMU01_00210 [Tenuibacillus multivorans]
MKDYLGLTGEVIDSFKEDDKTIYEVSIDGISDDIYAQRDQLRIINFA